MNKVKQFTSWSASRYFDYRRCPAYANYKHLQKLPEPKSPAMARGADIAKASEDYLTKKVRKLAPELHTFKEEYALLRKERTMFCEQQWGFNRDWAPVAWNDWDNCWLRSKVDIGWTEGNVLQIRDGKTGKFNLEKNEEYMQQLELYATGGMIQHPSTVSVTVALWYTDLGVTFPTDEPAQFKRSELPALKKTWEKRVKPMFTDKKFAPRPGQYCRWCSFSKSKGGPCKF